jgi:uncharacterized repeat protein (TIGR03837 family)
VNQAKTCDIFCRVVDNFGDVGVTWRLARQLTEEFDWRVRLFVDDVSALEKLLSEEEIAKHKQGRASPSILAWESLSDNECLDKYKHVSKSLQVAPAEAGAQVSPSLPETARLTPMPFDKLRANGEFLESVSKQSDQTSSPVTLAQIIIEAFACELPASVITAMAHVAQDGHAPIWLNLEYLSAEAWIDEHHLLGSPHPTLPLTKHFFFPGFTPKTGGLIRERRITPARPAQNPSAPIKTFVFAYDSPSAARACEVLANDANVTLTMPEWASTTTTPLLARLSSHPFAQKIAHQSFVPQRDFDALLREFDFLVVRGEDSFLRAQYAAKPFLWHIYPQDEDAHLVKLNAFLDRYVVGLDASAANALRELWMCWNAASSKDFQAAWAEIQPHFSSLQAHAIAWQHALLRETDLATRLVTFCEKTIKI